MPKLPRARQTREASPAPQKAKPVGAAARSASLQYLAPGAIVQRAMAAPRSLRPAELISMQRTIGNRRVGATLGRTPVQAKPIVNAPGDQYEREADRLAEAVLRMPSTPREETPGQQVSLEIMSKSDAVESGNGGFAVGEDFTRRLLASQGQGSPLPPPLRETFETNFGANFSGVRIHSSEQASQLSHDIQAQAFTHGSDIFLGAGNYAPGTAAGKRLLAHELTHVVQQGAAPPKARTAPEQVSRPKSAVRIEGPFEAGRVSAGDPAGAGVEATELPQTARPGAEGIIQRQIEKSKLNLVGEDHDESDKRRPLEKQMLQAEYNFDPAAQYWLEPDFVTEKGVKGDSRDLLALHCLTSLDSYCLQLEIALLIQKS